MENSLKPRVFCVPVSTFCDPKVNCSRQLSNTLRAQMLMQFNAKLILNIFIATIECYRKGV